MCIISINRYKSSYLLNINLHRHQSHKNIRFSSKWSHLSHICAICGCKQHLFFLYNFFPFHFIPFLDFRPFMMMLLLMLLLQLNTSYEMYIHVYTYRLKREKMNPVWKNDIFVDMKDKCGKRWIYEISYMDFYTTADDDDGITIKSFTFWMWKLFSFPFILSHINFVSASRFIRFF